TVIAFAGLVVNLFVVRDANTEVFALPFIVASLLAFLEERYLLAGIFGGVAAMTKTPFLIPVIALVPFAPWRKGWLVLAGAASMLLVTVTPWIFSGEFHSFWYANVTFNLKYGGATSAAGRATLALVGTLPLILGSMPLIALALFGVHRTRSWSRSERLIL